MTDAELAEHIEQHADDIAQALPLTAQTLREAAGRLRDDGSADTFAAALTCLEELAAPVATCHGLIACQSPACPGPAHLWTIGRHRRILCQSCLGAYGVNDHDYQQHLRGHTMPTPPDELGYLGFCVTVDDGHLFLSLRDRQDRLLACVLIKAADIAQAIAAAPTAAPDSDALVPYAPVVFKIFARIDP